MMLEIEIDGRASRVSVERVGSGSNYRFLIDGHPADANAVNVEPGTWSLVLPDGTQHVVGISGRPGTGFVIHLPLRDVPAGLAGRTGRSYRNRASSSQVTGSGPAQIVAPMPGKVVRVLVTAGQSVQAGEGMVVVEAMKMENELRAPRAGVVKQIMARPGQSVESGAVLAVVS
jgi:hypothetical protein